MKREEKIKNLLVSNAINLIAEGGFEKATTRELAYYSGNLPDIKMNEVYIYRLFGSKENVYAAAFIYLDDELFDAFKSAIRAVGGFTEDVKEHLYQFFLLAWRFILKNEVHCRCYVRYYYSIYFRDESKERHKKKFDSIIVPMAAIFKEDANVSAILHSVFTAVLDFAIRVYNGELENNDDSRHHIFNVLYCMMATYFRESVQQEGCR